MLKIRQSSLPKISAARTFGLIQGAQRHLAVVCAIGIILLCLIKFSLFGGRDDLVDIYKKGTQRNSPTGPESSEPKINHFRDFKTSSTCNFSSLDLFVPSQQTCKGKETLLMAMGSGGRIGFDAPYIPRYCDMTWFSTSEICSILSKYSAIYFIGDSLNRNVFIAFLVLLRQDLVNGGIRSWDPPVPEVAETDCTCENAIENTDCSWYRSVLNTNTVYENDPESMACPRDTTASFWFHMLTSHPLKKEDVGFFTDRLPTAKPSKPIAIILSHGLWNDFLPDKTVSWLAQVLNGALQKAPWLMETVFPRLLITPNAQGQKKLEIFHQTQNNFILQTFEKKIGELLEGSNIDHLGMYNMSVQTYSWDGTHSGMKVDLLKSMMILNWLNSYDLTEWSDS